jgi:ATP-binding cassette subfamily F protein 3
MVPDAISGGRCMIAFQNVAKFQAGKWLFREASFQINPGERVGLVGANGAGKSTIFRAMVGQEGIDEGTIAKPERTVIGYFSQDPASEEEMTVLACTMTGSKEVHELGRQIDELSEALADPNLDGDAMTRILEDLGEAQMRFETLGGYDLETRAQEILGGLGFSAADQQRLVKEFSGGWRMRIELAKVLLLKPDVLLLDEPTNHLDLESIIWLEEFLGKYPGSILMTSHDRDFMNRLVKKIVAVEFNTVNVYSGNYDFYEQEYALRLTNLEAQAKRQEDKLAKEEEFIARFKARASHASSVQSRVKMLEKMDRIEVPKEAKAPKFIWPECPRSGDQIVVVDGLSKSYGEKKVLTNCSFEVKRQERVALLGVNGAGKSTMLKIIANQLEHDSGNCKLGSSLQMAYFAQHQLEVLDPEQTLFDSVQDVAPQMNRTVLQTLLGSLLFTGDDVDKKIKVLSGGERTRVVLARILAKPVNFLVMDEPTNHLDLRTREILLAALQDFEGTVVFVSHDRHFLRDVATKIVLIDHGTTTVYEGGLTHYLDKNGHKFPSAGHTLRVG